MYDGARPTPMDRLADLDNCTQTVESDHGMLCNHGGGFLDRYDWGYVCGNCGATFIWKESGDEKSRT